MPPPQGTHGALLGGLWPGVWLGRGWAPLPPPLKPGSAALSATTEL